MRRKKVNMQKPLFVVDRKESLEKDSANTKSHRGRPRKNKDTQVQQVISDKKTRQKKIMTTEQKLSSSIKADRGWKDFNKTKPELMRPCEFYVEGKNGKRYEFRGYIKEPGCTVTDEPYYLVVLRKRYGNMFYREIKSCTDVRSCPEEFPRCEKCKLNK